MRTVTEAVRKVRKKWTDREGKLVSELPVLIVREYTISRPITALAGQEWYKINPQLGLIGVKMFQNWIVFAPVD